MRCVITDTGDTLDCQCGRKWPKLPPQGAPQDCFPMLAANLRRAENALANIIAVYESYYGDGELPAPGAYAALVKAINAARPSDNAGERP